MKMMISSKSMNNFLVVLILCISSGDVAAEPDAFTVSLGGEEVNGPIFELQHGRALFANTGGTGCYEGARGQAQARFDIVDGSVANLFVPAVTWIFDEDGPQDTTLKKVDDGNRRRMTSSTGNADILVSGTPNTGSRKLVAPFCDVFRSGDDGFAQISFTLEKRSNHPNPGGSIQDTASSHHEHGMFQARQEWFGEVKGEYSLSCIFHECKMSFFFEVKDGPMSSLNLQGTTELAYEGVSADMLRCVDHCDGIGGDSVQVDSEFVTVRNFDNTASRVQVDKGGKTAKNTKQNSGGSQSGGSKKNGVEQNKGGGAEKNKGDAEKNKGGDEKNKGGGKVAKSTTKATGGNEQGPLSSLYVPVPTAPPPTPPRPSLPTFWNNRPTAPPPTAAMPSLPTFYNIISRPVPTAPPPSPVAPPPTWPAAPPPTWPRAPPPSWPTAPPPTYLFSSIETKVGQEGSCFSFARRTRRQRRVKKRNDSDA